MFIAVCPYKAIDRLIKDKILVFDTDDYSLEYVTTEDLMDSGVVVDGIANKSGHLCYSGIRNYQFAISDKMGDVVGNLPDNLCFRLRYGFPFIKISIKNSHVHLNGTRLKHKYGTLNAVLSYVFKFENYYVARFCLLNQGYSYYTAVLDKDENIVLQYSSDFEVVVGDFALARRIDLTTGY